MERFVELLGHVADNVWAFLLFGLASLIAVASGVLALVLAYRLHVADYTIAKELLQFASTIAMTGAALFHGKDKGGPGPGSKEA